MILAPSNSTSISNSTKTCIPWLFLNFLVKKIFQANTKFQDTNKTRGILKQLAINIFFWKKLRTFRRLAQETDPCGGSLIHGTTGSLLSLHALFHSDSDYEAE